MSINILKQYKSLVQIQEDEVTKTISFESISGAIDREKAFVSITVYPDGDLTSPKHLYVTPELLDDGSGKTYQLQLTRGGVLPGVNLYVYYSIIYSNELKVTHVSSSFSDFTNSITTISADTSKAFPLSYVYTTDSFFPSDGDNIHDFMVSSELTSTAINYKKFTNIKSLTVKTQIIESDNFEVVPIHISETATNPHQYPVSTEYTAENSFIVLSYNATDTFSGVGYYKRAFINKSTQNLYIDNNGVEISKAECFVYIVKITGDNAKITQKIINTPANLEEFSDLYKYPKKIFCISGCQYGYLFSPNDSYGQNQADAAGLLNIDSDNTEIDFVRNSDGVNVLGAFSVIELEDSQINSILLHYVHRGVGIGVSNGVC